MKRLFLLDAYALIYRAYFAFAKNPLINSKGQNVSAVSGFVSTLIELIQREQPTHMAVCFDMAAPTERASAFEFYKANRQAMPEDIRWAVPYIRKIIRAMRIPILESSGYEADDVVGTIAKRAEKDDFMVYMVTPDKDYGQLVSDKVYMYKPAYLKNPVEIMGVKEILAKWDIERVDQVIDLLGLMGDQSDNIPGIPGVGEKTAVKLLKDFGSVENLLANTDKLVGKLKEKVEAGRELALISKQLATIICDVPLDYRPEEYELEEYDKEKLTELFRELEFRALGKKIIGNEYSLNPADDLTQTAAQKTTPTTGRTQMNLFAEEEPTEEERRTGKNITNTPHEYFLAQTEAQRAELIANLMQQKTVCFDSETTALDANTAEIIGLAFSYEPYTGWYVPFPADFAGTKAVLDEFRPFFENESIEKVGQNLKYDLLALKKYEVNVRGTLHDTMLAHYLLKPELRHNLNFLSETYLRYTPVAIEELIGKKGKDQLNMRQVAVERVAEYAAEDADLTIQLHQKLYPELKKQGFTKLYEEVEMPLVMVLTDMEYEGMKVDMEFLKSYSKELTEELRQLVEEIYESAGTVFNIDSPKQLGDVLFNRLKITVGKKTRTGQQSTDEQTLAKLAEEHPVVAKIMDYRQLNKLRGTYIDALPLLINPQSGRVHTTFNQAVASTGRLSSTNPNLQNIPIRTERGREIRRAFIPRDENHTLLSADYSQIELRLMAAMSGDEAMTEAFQQGLDIHTATASRVFGVALDEVTGDMRRKAKMVELWNHLRHQRVWFGSTAQNTAGRGGRNH